MSKVRLGKTRDSRTRAKQKPDEAGKATAALNKHSPEWEGFIHYLLSKGLSQRTADRYIKDVKQYLRWADKENLPIEDSSYADVLHFMQYRRKNVIQKTICMEVNSIRYYFDYLVREGIAGSNPAANIVVKGIKRKVLYEVLPKTELEKLYHGFDANRTSEPKAGRYRSPEDKIYKSRDKAIVGLMVHQGLMQYELAELTEKDLKLREGRIQVPGGRKSEERELVLEAHQIMDLMEYIMKDRPQVAQRTGKQNDKLFLDASQADDMYNLCKKILDRIKLQNPKVTSLLQIRASVIAHWLKIHNLRKAQYLAGHRFISSTEAYLVNDMDDMSEEINRCHPLG